MKLGHALQEQRTIIRVHAYLHEAETSPEASITTETEEGKATEDLGRGPSSTSHR